MKNFVTYTLAASLAAGAAAEHQHGHQHFHRGASKVVKRDPAVVTEYVVAATETVYELDGKILTDEEAEQGIESGDYVVISEAVAAATSTFAPAVTTTSAAEFEAEFYESVAATTSTSTSTSTSSSSSSSSSTSSSTTFSTSTHSSTSTSTSFSTAWSTTESEAATSTSSSSSSTSTGTGVDAEFPSGEIKCSEFPSSYGAVALTWLDFDGWSGIQYVPDYSVGDTSISDIVTGVAGDSCTENAFCSYACPVGYQKTQWPTAQGSTGQSIGGLYCNSDGYLELSRTSYKTLCQEGEGGVTIQNDLSEGVATCRTDYPGTESMVVPAYADAGSSITICNPDESTYYQWEGSGTSAQYYVNKKGYTDSEACVWTSTVDADGAGNWAPVILGVGMSDDLTYISIFPNTPTSNATIDYNIEITGGSIECYYKDGAWSGDTDGCTVSVSSGDSAVVRYWD